MEKGKEKVKKQFKMPHTFVIIFVIIVAAIVLTWIIPGGQYARYANEKGIKVIDPTKFNYIKNTPVSPLMIPMYIVEAFIKNIDLLLVILFSGGAFHMLTKSEALQTVIAKLAKRFSNHIGVFIPILTLVFGLICTTQGVNMFIAFAPVMVMMSLALGLDSICGVAIILLGGAIGFSTGTLNVSTTIISQKIADLPLYSGIGYRAICFIVYFIATNIYLVRYAKKVRKDPEISPMYDLDLKNELKETTKLENFGEMDGRKWAIILCLVAALGAIVYGCILLGWSLKEQSCIFLTLGIAVGIIAGFDANTICKEFLNGCKIMLGAAFIIGLARSIGSIMADGQIIDTVVHSLAKVLDLIPFYLQGVGMLIANTIINVFITSGSGQASVVMPIMIPLADLIGMTRQTTILAFNFGDGFCNYILPTSTALMGIIGAANIPYDRWMKFMWKCFILWLVVGSVMIIIAQIIKLGPM